MRTGSCQCGLVEYRVSGRLFDCCFCHCSICRKLTGSAMGTYGTIETKHFEWLRGEAELSTYQQNESLSRMFCSTCGSTLASTHSLTPSRIYLALGCINDASDIEIEYQQFVASCAEWATVDQSIEAHDQWPNWIKDRIE